jgi:hypothetical protein
MIKQVCLVLGLLTSSIAHGASATVECRGFTLDEAKQNCFRSAIEQTVGQVIVSDTETSGDHLIKDKIGKYSSGYVDDYTIIDSREDAEGQWRLKMMVTVTSSKIANRMLTKAEQRKIVDGEHLQAKMASELEQRSHGDQLIAQVLASYPENAYVINSGKTEFKIDRLRQSYVDIPYNITMSQHWVVALDEALDLVAINSAKCNTLQMTVANVLTNTGDQIKRLASNICGREPDIRVFYKNRFIPSANSYYFADVETLHVVNNEIKSLGQQRLGLRVDLLDAGGNVIDSRCANINNELFIHYEAPAGSYDLSDRHINSRPSILGQNNVYGTLRVNIRSAEQLEELATIKLNIQRTCV